MGTEVVVLSEFTVDGDGVEGKIPDEEYRTILLSLEINRTEIQFK